MKKMTTTTQLFLMLFFKLLFLHHGCEKGGVIAFPESLFDMNGETVELSFEDSNSMEATTFFNEPSSDFEATPPNHIQATITTIAPTSTVKITTTTISPITETSIHEMISQTASPLLMKLIAPQQIESTATESNIINVEMTSVSAAASQVTKSSSPVSRKSFKSRPHLFLTEVPQAIHYEQSDETLPIIASKKPRLLAQAKTSQFKTDAEIDSNSMEDTTTVADLETENNETNIDIGEDVTTIIPPLQPQPSSSSSSATTASSSTSKRPPKNIEIFKTRPNELLRFYVEDGHLRSPIAALVDKKSNPLAKAKKLWKAALRPNSLLDIMVVSYDSEGIKSTYNLTNTKAMMTTLDKVREENITDQESKTYYSIIRTGQLIPFDSAIFLSTDDLPNDTEHQLQASMFLLKKRIRVSCCCFKFLCLSLIIFSFGFL